MTLELVWIIIALLTSGGVWAAAAAFVNKADRTGLLVVLFALAAIGTTVGLAGGMSRVGAVGDVMTAALGLLGGVVVWLFAADRTKGLVVSLCAIVFSTSLFLSYFQGAEHRKLPDDYEYWRQTCVAKYTDTLVLNDERARFLLGQFMGELCANIFKNEKQKLLVDRVAATP